jgi:uncharacterized protein YcbK (DUF882 family)
MQQSTPPQQPSLSRRGFIGLTGAALAGLALDPVKAFASSSQPRSLTFLHTHTHEALELVFADGPQYRPAALATVNQFLRDFRTEQVHPIDPSLLDLLHALAKSTGTTAPFHVISGYRSPETNAMLHAHSEGVAVHSLHMDGKAIDIRLPDIALPRLHSAALDLRRGGVGFYPASDFVHVDTGRVRVW